MLHRLPIFILQKYFHIVTIVTTLHNKYSHSQKETFQRRPHKYCYYGIIEFAPSTITLCPE